MNIKKDLLTYQKKILDQNDLSDIGLCGEVKDFPTYQDQERPFRRGIM